MSHYSFKAKCPACMAFTNWSAIDLGRDGYQYACRRCGYVTYDKPERRKMFDLCICRKRHCICDTLDSEQEDG